MPKEDPSDTMFEEDTLDVQENFLEVLELGVAWPDDIDTNEDVVQIQSLAGKLKEEMDGAIGRVRSLSEIAEQDQSAKEAFEEEKNSLRALVQRNLDLIESMNRVLDAHKPAALGHADQETE